MNADHHELEVYVAGTHVGPHNLSHVQEVEKAATIACQKKLVWILARLADQKSQAVPSWTGFNIRTRNQVQISEDIVGSLPTINVPAIEMNTHF